MLPEAKKAKALLYITDGTAGDAYVYSYPKGKLVGTLTGFSDPGGECVDAKGDVFITENYGHEIDEYAHGGTARIATLNDTDYQPYDCKVDPTTGNLAVANVVTEYFTQGNLAIFKNASGSPTYYSLPGGSSGGWFSCNTVGVDNKGNVFFAGNGTASNTLQGELPKGASSLENITLNQSFGGPGEVQWDGKHITFADRNTGDIYAFTISGSSGTEVGSTKLTGSSNVQWSWIDGKTVVVPQNSGSDVYFYKYPAGGNATKTIGGFSSPPSGATISIAKKK
jgi:hypothetical protein